MQAPSLRGTHGTQNTELRYTLVRLSAQGLGRYCSAYLLSALLVLLGGYLTLYEDAKLTTVALDQVFGSQLAYQLLLVAVLTFLRRLRDEIEMPVFLAGILSLFLIDGLLVQQLYGWDGDGLIAAGAGTAAGLSFLIMTALALQIPIRSRGVLSLASAIVFIRFGPHICGLDAWQSGLNGAYVALGWLLAACLLPALFLSAPAEGGGRLPLRKLDAAATLLASVFAGVHFVTAGRSFGVELSPLYFAPAVILLGPVLERSLPPDRRPSLRRLAGTGALPYLGLLFAASLMPAGMLSAHWAQAWPLTPFTLALPLAALVQLGRGLRREDPTLKLAGAGLLALACLGGDLPEIVVHLRYPSALQVGLVAALVWGAIRWTRFAPGALVLQALPAFLLASWLGELEHRTEHGNPIAASYVVLLALGALAVERAVSWPLPPRLRLGLTGVVTIVPLAALCLEPDSQPRLVMAAGACGLLLIWGWLGADRLFRLAVPIGAAGGLCGYLIAIQHGGDVSAGQLLTELGFVALLLGFLDSVAGAWFRDQCRTWWQRDARPEL